MSTPQIYRQGDLGFIPIESMPKSAKPLDNRLIRKGETGGLHLLEEKKGSILYEDERGVKYVMSEDGVGILHGEHKRVDLPPGQYEVRVQRELGANGEQDVID